MSAGRAVAVRLVVTVVVALVVVGLAVVAPLLTSSAAGGGISAAPDQPEWSPGNISPDRLEKGGDANPSGDVGVVLFDRSHGNRFQTEDVSPLVDAVNDAGGEVQFTDTTTPLATQLNDADVLVVIDPSERYDSGEVEAIEEFVDNGGRVLMAHEPNRRTIQATGFGVTLADVRSSLDSAGSPFGISFGSRYVYDMETNDGNFKDPVTSPPSGTNADAVEGVDSVTMYTAASVSVNRGTVLLRTSPSAERAGETTDSGFPVAVLSASGAVMAVGDTTFFSDRFHTVADNEVFIQRIVEFMTEADHDPPAQEPPGNETEQPPAASVAGASG